MPAHGGQFFHNIGFTNQDKNEGKGGDTADKGEAETKKQGKKRQG